MRRVLCSRTVFVILLLAMQLAVLLLPFRQLSTYSLLSAVMIIYIINKRTNPEFKLDLDYSHRRAAGIRGAVLSVFQGAARPVPGQAGAPEGWHASA